jgi:hypothetical protein
MSNSHKFTVIPEARRFIELNGGPIDLIVYDLMVYSHDMLKKD